MPKILVILPTYNERENIGALLDSLFRLPIPVNVLVIDDGSPDGTAEVVREKQEVHGHDWLRLLVRKDGKAGRGSACLYGFNVAQEEGYDAAIEMDADFSHDPGDIPKLLGKITEADVIIGSKYLPESRIEGWGWCRRLLSYGANTYAWLLLRMPVRDYTNGYRCYSARALALLPTLEIDGTGFTVIPQMAYRLHQAGMRFAEVPIVFRNRQRGKSNMSLKEISESFFAILKLRSHGLYLHTKQFLKFGITGFANTFLDLGLLAFCVEVLHLPLRLSVFVAGVIAVTSAFLINKHWTFRNDERRYAKQYVHFLAVYFSSFLINASITILLAEQLRVWYILAKIIAIPASATWNYLWLHFGVFRRSAV